MRLILQFYIQEKQVYLEKLKISFAEASIMGGKNLDANLNFLEFRDFIDNSFKTINALETSQVYRVAWNLGNGTVSFSSFLSAAYIHRIFLREIQMENSATLSLSHVETKISQEMGSYMLSDEMSELLKPMEELVYILYDEGGYIGNPHHLDCCQKLTEFMNNTLVFNSREEIIYQGDKLNLIVNIWISLLKSVVTLRTVSLESAKFNRPVIGRKSEVLRDEILNQFKRFMKGVNFEYLDSAVPTWVGEKLTTLQRKARRIIMKKAREHFELNG